MSLGFLRFHWDDQHDAFFLAQLLILDILPQGYIYPKDDRPVRDLASSASNRSTTMKRSNAGFNVTV
jgi:hypothetical protein